MHTMAFANLSQPDAAAPHTCALTPPPSVPTSISASVLDTKRQLRQVLQNLCTNTGICTADDDGNGKMELANHAWDLLQTAVFGNQCHEELHKDTETNRACWIACAVFVANQVDLHFSTPPASPPPSLHPSSSKSTPTSAINTHKPKTAELSVTQLICATNVRATDFCRHLHHFCSHLSFSQLPHHSSGSDSVKSDSGSTGSHEFCEKVKRFQLQLLQIFGLFKRYEEFFKEYEWPLYNSWGSNAHDNGATPADLLFGFGWLLFLVAKAALLDPDSQASLREMYVMLLCVQAFMIKSAKGAHLQLDSEKLQRNQVQRHDDSDVETILRTLCVTKSGKEGVSFDTDLFQHAKTFHISRFQIFLKNLVQEEIVSVPTPLFSASSSRTVDNSSISSPDGIVSLDCLQANCHSLAYQLDKEVIIIGQQRLSQHHQYYDRGFWLDERIFLQEGYETRLGSPLGLYNYTKHPKKPGHRTQSSRRLFSDFDDGTPHSPASVKITKSGAGATSAISSAYSSPHRPTTATDAYSTFSPALRSPSYRQSAPSTTPVVHRMLTEVFWITNTLNKDKGATQHIPGAPFEQQNFTSVLSTFLLASNTALSDSATLGTTTQCMLDCVDGSWAVFSSSAVPMLHIVHKQLAISLFYYVLERILVKEAARCDTKAFPSLLMSHSFHNAILACCFEVVVFSYKIDGLSFPRILNLTHSTAFDFLKVCESIVRALTTLPSSIKAHLQHVEDTALDSLVWRTEGEEQLHRFLSREDFRIELSKRLRPEIVSQTPRPTPFQTLGTTDFSSSNFQSQSPHIATTFTTSQATQSLSSSQQNRKTSGQKFALEMLYRRLFAVACDRLDFLCGYRQLNLPAVFTEEIWNFLRHILLNHFTLLFNRHLDTIIMCAIYCVCRITGQRSHTSITFHSIISRYLGRWEHNTMNVVRKIRFDDKEYDIISFYNTHFVALLKQYVLRAVKPAVERIIANSANSSDEPLLHHTPHIFSSPRRLSSRRLAACGGRSPTTFLLSSPFCGCFSPPSITPTVATKSYQSSALSTSVSAHNTNSPIYAFGESPAKNLAAINRRVNKNSTGRRLFSDSDQELNNAGLDGLVSASSSSPLPQTRLFRTSSGPAASLSPSSVKNNTRAAASRKRRRPNESDSSEQQVQVQAARVLAHALSRSNSNLSKGLS